MRLSHIVNNNEIMVENDISLSMSTEDEEEMVDLPIGGKSHPATIRHHREMSNLSHNEINFSVIELISLLDNPSTGYITREFLNKTHRNEANQSLKTPTIPKGICEIHNRSHVKYIINK